MLVTDLDGTLLDENRKIGCADLETLMSLGKRGVLRVVATGRSLYSLGKVLRPGAPIDFIIFSTGAGILDFRSHRIVRRSGLAPMEVAEIARTLDAMELDYMVHRPIPDNHHFLYRVHGAENPDFQRRCRYYADFCRPADDVFLAEPASFGTATQFVVVEADGHTPSLHLEVSRRLRSFTVVRTTSPMDGRTLWIEVFPKSVSKALGAAWLAERHGMTAEDALAVGNDHNDLDLLEWAGTAFVVSNAAPELRGRFAAVAPHTENGLSEAVGRWLSRRGGAGENAET